MKWFKNWFKNLFKEEKTPFAQGWRKFRFYTVLVTSSSGEPRTTNYVASLSCAELIRRLENEGGYQEAVILSFQDIERDEYYQTFDFFRDKAVARGDK